MERALPGVDRYNLGLLLVIFKGKRVYGNATEHH
jgi:hypothetical protein